MAVLALTLCSGCAVHYFNRDTQTEHLWGFGHLKMRAAPQPAFGTSATNTSIAFVTSVRTLGLNLGIGEDFSGVAAGWDARSRVVIRAPDACFSLVWPTNAVHWPGGLQNFFTVRVGTNLPPLIDSPTPDPP
jgi:hypothetical protein